MLVCAGLAWHTPAWGAVCRAVLEGTARWFSVELRWLEADAPGRLVVSAAILNVTSSRSLIGIDHVTRRLRRNVATPVVAVEMEVR
jgi:hypothetical protein